MSKTLQSLGINEVHEAFAGWDSGIFLASARAMADMMLAGGDPNTMAEHTLENYGGLMHALIEAAEALQARESAAMRKAA